MLDFLETSLLETWNLAAAGAPYLLLGFALAGILHVLAPMQRVMKWLSVPGWRSVWRAAAVGTPLPLCSCSVVPVAASLRQRGATRGATTSFLISTPESGVDSIALTWALMDPLMTIARPVAAFGTAVAAGLTQDRLHREHRSEQVDVADNREPADVCCNASASADSASDCKDGCGDVAERAPRGWVAKLRAAWRYAFVDLFDDLGLYLIVGFVLSGVLAAVLQSFDPLRAALGSPWAYPLMLIAGVPVYVCSASVTPLVAVLIAEGLAPGAGLVFLLAGPATNAATIAVVQRILGGRGLVVYLACIMGCAVLAGLAVDWIYRLLTIAPAAEMGVQECADCGATYHVFAIILAVLLGWSILRKHVLPHFRTAAPAASEA